MNRIRLVIPFLVLVFGVVAVMPARGQGGFIITGADATQTLGMTSSAPLGTLLGQVGPRIVVSFANTVHHHAMTTPPTVLQGQLASVAPRIVVQFANDIRIHALAYPAALINDTIAPQITNLTVSSMAGSNATVTWDTDEFADTKVLYGTTSGNLNLTAYDPLYVKQHSITLSGLVPGTTYYYRAQSRDQSNNVTASQQLSFTFQPQSHLYLPLVIR